MGLKKKLGLKWIADFRDPWTKIEFYEELKLSSWADKKHHKLEQEVLNKADGIIGVGKGYIKNLLPIPESTPVAIITNGYDHEDFEGLTKSKSEDFTICHFGSMNKTRNPIGLWEALSSLKDQNPALLKNVKVKLYGTVDHIIMESVKAYGLSSMVELVEYLPHDEMLKELVNSDLLLLMINRISQGGGLIPGKVFEYIGSGNPILGIGPTDSHVAEVLEESKSGRMLDWEDTKGIEDFLLEHLDSKAERPENKEKLKYSRKYLTEKLQQFFDQVV
jgi:hypothetical protein